MLSILRKNAKQTRAKNYRLHLKIQVPKNGKKPPFNLRKDLNSIVKTGIVTSDACSVYDVQNTKKHSISLPDEQKSNDVERTVHVKN